MPVRSPPARPCGEMSSHEMVGDAAPEHVPPFPALDRGRGGGIEHGALLPDRRRPDRGREPRRRRPRRVGHQRPLRRLWPADALRIPSRRRRNAAHLRPAASPPSRRHAPLVRNQPRTTADASPYHPQSPARRGRSLDTAFGWFTAGGRGGPLNTSVSRPYPAPPPASRVPASRPAPPPCPLGRSVPLPSGATSPGHPAPLPAPPQPGHPAPLPAPPQVRRSPPLQSHPPRTAPLPAPERAGPHRESAAAGGSRRPSVPAQRSGT